MNLSAKSDCLTQDELSEFKKMVGCNFVSLRFHFVCICILKSSKFVLFSFFQIRFQLEEYDISTYKFAFTPEDANKDSKDSKDNKDSWMCDLSPFAVVGSNTIIQVSNIIICVISGRNNDDGQMKKSEAPLTVC